MGLRSYDLFASPKALLFALSASLLLTLTGCGMDTTTVPSTMAGVSVKGSLHGGQPPLSGAHVYLMAAANTTFGDSSTSLLSSGDGSDGNGTYVLSQGDGSFSITGDYNCTANQELYILALGGNPGLPGNVDASQISLMAPLGLCSNVSSSTYVVVNELSTVTFAYSLAGFMSSPTQVATQLGPLGATGLSNAFAADANLEYRGQAIATTPGGNGTVPQQEINTLANIIAACVNTSSGGSTQCSTLFSNAMSGGNTPTDTAQAAINIAHNPGAVNVSSLFGLQTAQSPFEPSLSSAPADFSVGITYTASGLGQSGVPAIDASGNVWLSGYLSPLVKLSPVGAQLSPHGGYTGAGNLSGESTMVDMNGHVWVTNNGTVAEFGSDGSFMQTVGGTPGTGNPPSYETLAIDTSDNIWFSISTSISEFSDTGSVISQGAYANNGCCYNAWIALDSTNTVWSTDKDGYVRTYDSSNGNPINAFQDGAYGASAPLAMAIDSSNNAWVADTNTSEISLYNNGSSGQVATYTGGGTNKPYGIAIDGNSSVWVVNLAGTVSAFDNNGNVLTPAAGYAIPTNSSNPEGVFDAVDGSGNLWVSFSNSNQGPIVEEFIGITTPVATPIDPNHLGVRPYTPLI